MNLGSSTHPNHPNNFGIIFDAGPDPKSDIQDLRSKIPGRDSGAILDLDLESQPESKIIRMIRASTGTRIKESWILDPGPNQKWFQNHPDDSGLPSAKIQTNCLLARIIRIMLASFLIRGRIQDSWEVFPVNLGSSTCPNHPHHFGNLF